MSLHPKIQEFVLKYNYLLDESIAEFYRKANQFLTPEEIGQLGCLMNDPEIMVCMTQLPQFFLYGQDVTQVLILPNITHIGEDAFSDCTQLDTVTLHTGLQTIGDYAFHGCAKLRTIFIPDTVTFIGDHAFKLCSSLTILAHKGTYGEEYAKKHHIPFSCLNT